MNDFLLLNIITKGFSKVVSIHVHSKLSYDHDILYLVSGPFLLLKNTFLLNSSFDETARSVSGIVRKVYIYLFRDCKYLYCEYFGGKLALQVIQFSR